MITNTTNNNNVISNNNNNHIPDCFTTNGPSSSTHTNAASSNYFGLSFLGQLVHLLLKLLLCIIFAFNFRFSTFVDPQLPTTRLTSEGVVEASSHMRMTQRNNHANISELLDNLLRGYDNSIRPDFGGPPTVIEVDIMVRSMGPISEVDMTYSMDCYFRQSWVDTRLAFGGAQDTLALSVSMLGRIWKPDTYFYNGKQSYLHTITTPNKFVRIYQNGRVLYSSRLTIKAGCPMNLEDFPMDIQRCPLKFGSFGYTVSDVVYHWNKERPAVAIAKDMKLSQFDLVDCPADNLTDIIHHSPPTAGIKTRDNRRDKNRKKTNKSLGTFNLPASKNRKQKSNIMTFRLNKRASGSRTDDVYALEDNRGSEYSMLLVNFHLQRHMGNFLIQVYGPCCLLVVLSWVSFWLNREATADRVSLGITTVLTMTFLGLEARTDLPKVAYPTALDFFVFLSFSFIFATILQFAVVHYFTKYGSGECYFIIEESDSECETSSRVVSVTHRLSSNSDSKLYEVIPLSMHTIPTTPALTDKNKRRKPEGKQLRSSSSNHRFFYFDRWRQFLNRDDKKGVNINTVVGDDNSDGCGGGEKPNESEKSRLRAAEDLATDQIQSSGRRRMSYYRREEMEARRKGKRTPQYNSVSRIDRASRVVFPVLFFLINAFYWWAYLSRSPRILNRTPTTS